MHVNADTANLVVIDASATSPVTDPPSVITLHGSDLNASGAVAHVLRPVE